MISDIWRKTKMQCLKYRCIFEGSSSILYIVCQKMCICLKKDIFDKLYGKGNKEKREF